MASRRIRMGTIGFVLVVLGFAWGLIALLMMRFETGGLFPPYSSFRNDPIGTKALYASLEQLPGMTVQRFTDPLGSLADGPAGQTVFLLGANTQQPNKAPESMLHELGEVMERGGRVVLTFAPNAADFEMEYAAPEPAEVEPEDDNARARQERQLAMTNEMLSLKDEWGIELDFEGMPFLDGDLIPETADLNDDGSLPESMAWHSGLQFVLHDSKWQTIYENRGYPVVVERAFGDGALVLVGDSYYVTNEGLAVDRQPEWLAWLVGDASAVTFDERHLGMARNPGTAHLIRRYGLESVVVGLIVLAALFMWRAGSSLAPRYEDSLPADAADLERGRDAHAGFANLVQRSIPKKDATDECVKQFVSSVLPGLRRSDAEALKTALDQTAASHRSSRPEDAYREVLNQLKERNVIIRHDR
jgi:hypothetical protein